MSNTFTTGLGQPASELPPDWHCYSQIQCEIAIGRALLEARKQLKSEDDKAMIDKLMEQNNAGASAEGDA